MSFLKSLGVHVGQRMIAAGEGLFRSADAKETHALYERVFALFGAAGVLGDEGRFSFASKLLENVGAEIGIGPDHPRHEHLRALVFELVVGEGFFDLPEIDWTEKRSTSDWWAIRDQLLQQKAWAEDFERTAELIELGCVAFVRPLFDAVPDLVVPEHPEGDLVVAMPLLDRLGNVAPVLQNMMGSAFAQELKDANLFACLRHQLERNHVEISGGDPDDMASFTRQVVTPDKSGIKDPGQLAVTYLKGTPFLDFLNQRASFSIPTEARFEHTHMIAGSGHGKTQTLQYLICNDLPHVAAGERSVVVMDSQGDLIRNIASLKEFAPGGPLHDRLVLIDPSDVEYPVSLNLFDVGIERLQGYDALERERLTNSILELYDFVLGTLLAAEMTQKQNVIFRYVTRLMLHIPGATIHTLADLMEEGSREKFAKHIAKLEGTPRRFFDTEFEDKEFKQTRKQVLRRLWGILENQTFERMFSHPTSKLDVFSELNRGKIILINTAKDLLKEQGTQIFGRFFIALIAQAAQERATLKPKDRKPTFVYVDEAADYFDRNIGLILAQARKYRIGIVLAHQYLGQLDTKLQDAFAANTSIKLAGGVSSKDARALAPMLHAEPDMIERQPKGSYATSIRGHTNSAVPVRFPFGFLEDKEWMDVEGQEAVRARTRELYAVHHSELGQLKPQPDAPDAEPPDPPPGSSPPEPEGGSGNGPQSPSRPTPRAAETKPPKRKRKPKPPKSAEKQKPDQPEPPSDNVDTDPSEEW